MDSIEGVSLQLFHSGEPVSVDADGYAGRLSRGKALIQARVLPANVYGFTVDGRKYVSLKKETHVSGGQKIYRRKVQIKEANRPPFVTHTEYADNNLRLLRVDADGLVTTWETALISQGGEFFLTSQQIYQTRCYRDGDIISCPMFDGRWPQLADLISQLVKDQDALEDISAYRPEPKIVSDGLGPNQARVDWFNQASGMGGLITPAGAARVHWSEVQKRPRQAYLVPGELVAYESLRPPKQTTPRQTGFKLEAVGVKPLVASRAG